MTRKSSTNLKLLSSGQKSTDRIIRILLNFRNWYSKGVDVQLDSFLASIQCGMSGQLHPPGAVPRLSTEYLAGWTPQTVWLLQRREISLDSVGNRTTIPRSVVVLPLYRLLEMSGNARLQGVTTQMTRCQTAQFKSRNYGLINIHIFIHIHTGSFFI